MPTEDVMKLIKSERVELQRQPMQESVGPTRRDALV